MCLWDANYQCEEKKFHFFHLYSFCEYIILNIEHQAMKNISLIYLYLDGKLVALIQINITGFEIETFDSLAFEHSERMNGEIE